ncbi:DUF4389 domain-containing protein [Oceanobacter mangrovi]|uniref:DUF4389 domain-containing protein n=1 Tax=Oceanobacter mangrovi TaxID=2862510 RepID=UPI001C8E8D5C|nr:DUF4389 domain-containing protein [Oceanobacter mangrovi]
MSKGSFQSSVTSESFWFRTLYTVIFFVVVRILDLILLVATIVQWLARLFSGEVSSSVARFSYSLGLYYQQVVHYLTGCSDEKPFPFSDWPEPAPQQAAEAESAVDKDAAA